MTQTITPTQQRAIQDFLAYRHICARQGSREESCSIATINLALSGDLTSEIPKCMSLVIGKWIIRIQDAMPDDMRNSTRWRQLLPLSAGSGREPKDEQKRRQIIVDWMWDTVLPCLQPLAEQHNFGVEWRRMTASRSMLAATIARDAVIVSTSTHYASISTAVYFASLASPHSTASISYAAAAAVWTATVLGGDFWHIVDPCGLLERLINIDS